MVSGRLLGLFIVFYWEYHYRIKDLKKENKNTLCKGEVVMLILALIVLKMLLKLHKDGNYEFISELNKIDNQLIAKEKKFIAILNLY